MDELVPVSVLALDLEPPSTGGWHAYLSSRGIPVRQDDLGRRAITREAARRLFVEQREAEQRHREMVAQRDAELEAQRLVKARPGVSLPPGVSYAEAVAEAEYAAAGYAGPRRRSPVEDLLDGDGLVFHPLRHSGSDDDAA